MVPLQGEGDCGGQEDQCIEAVPGSQIPGNALHATCDSSHASPRASQGCSGRVTGNSGGDGEGRRRSGPGGCGGQAAELLLVAAESSLGIGDGKGSAKAGSQNGKGGKRPGARRASGGVGGGRGGVRY
ncbi:unnamed protein product, partial [Choristocarpus tenellus]